MGKHILSYAKTYRFLSSKSYPDEELITQVIRLAFSGKGNGSCKTVKNALYALAVQCAIVSRRKRSGEYSPPALKQFETDINGKSIF